MTSSIMAEGHVQDISEAIIPLVLDIGSKRYKFLVKGKTITALSENVTRQLQQILPENLAQDDPVFLNLENGKVILPGITTEEERSALQDEVLPCTSKTESPAGTDQTNEIFDVGLSYESSDENTPTCRFEWKYGQTKDLLQILIDKKKKNKDFMLNKSLWHLVSKEMAEKGSMKSPPNSSQCREKYYSLRRAFRKFNSESKKTGNRRPKPFLYETEMYDLLYDDPSFRPELTKSSLGTVERNDLNNNSSVEDLNDSDDNGKVKPKKKKTQKDSLTEYLHDRDERFLTAFKQLSDKQNLLLEKVIEKL